MPAHFLKPDTQGRQVVIILANQGWRSACMCGRIDYNEPNNPYKNYPHAIGIGLAGARPDFDFEESLGRLAHELVHLLTLENTGKTSFAMKKEYDKVDQILGVPYRELSLILKEQLESKIRPLVTSAWKPGSRYDTKEGLSEKEEEDLNFYGLLYSGVGGINRKDAEKPNEFIGYLTESYVLGREYFFRHCSEFFDPEIVERLYNFYKNDIFQGKEY